LGDQPAVSTARTLGHPEAGATEPSIHFTVVAMPAFLAAHTLEQTVRDLPATSADHLLLVDDASSDSTVEVARRLGIDVRVHDRNRGYGANQKTCYREALDLGATVIVLLHPDYQYDPKAVPALVAPILAGTADFTFGSRFACTGDPRSGGMPRYRYWGNRATTLIENVLLNTHFTEMHSGMKAYSRRFLESIPFEGYSDSFVFDTQILIDAVLGGFRIQEVAIPTRYAEGSSSVGVRRSLEYVTQSVGLCMSARRRRRSARLHLRVR
jgi:glycosyltransferase involved in cell wall biosynthesis